MSGLETVEGSVGPQLRSLPPWSRRGQSGGLTWHGCCTAGHPPHSPSRGPAVGRAVMTPCKEQWVSLTHPPSPGRTVSLSQEPRAVRPRVLWHSTCSWPWAPPVHTSALHCGRPHGLGPTARRPWAQQRCSHQPAGATPEPVAGRRGNKVASHARSVIPPSRRTRRRRLHCLDAPCRRAQ